MSGISGFRPADLSDATAAEEPQDAAAAPAPAPTVPTEAQIVRGGGPVTPEVAASVAHMNIHDLAQKLQAGGESRAQARKDAAHLMKTATDIDVLNRQLDALKTKEAALQAKLASPDEALWDQTWDELDLSKVELDMSKIEEKLGKLEGKLDTAIDKVRDAWSNALSTLDFYSTLDGIKNQQIDSSVDTSQSQRALDLDHRREDDRSAELERERHKKLADLGVIRPSPPESQAVKAELKKILDWATDAKTVKDHENFVKLHRMLDKARGG
jgi:hypothetical protein